MTKLLSSPRVFNILQFLRLVDENNLLSLTNITVVVCIVKVAMLQSVSLPDLGALMLSMLMYGHKKLLAANKSASKETPELIQKVEAQLKEQAEALKRVDTDSITTLKKNVEDLLQAETLRRMKGSR